MSHAYAVTNLCTALAASAYTPGAGPSDATRAYLSDGKAGLQYAFTANSGGNSLVIDFGSAQEVKGFAVCNSNIASASGTKTLKVESADNAGMTVNLWEAKAASTLCTTAPAHKDHVLQLHGQYWDASEVPRRYWRLTWAWSGSFALKVGEIFAYTYSGDVVLTRGIILGSGEGEDLITAENTMQYGDTRAAKLAGPIREKSALWADLTAAQRTELRTMWAAVNGPVTPLLWIESHESTTTAAAAAEQDCLFAKMHNRSYGWEEDDFGIYQPREGFVLRNLGREVGS